MTIGQSFCQKKKPRIAVDSDIEISDDMKTMKSNGNFIFYNFKD